MNLTRENHSTSLGFYLLDYGNKRKIMGQRVLLIQDDFDCKEVMKFILEEEGFDVITPSAEEVLAKSITDFDLVIVDEYSEGRIGCEICKELKSNDQTCKKPVLLTSTTPGLKNIAKECKADTYLVKPFDIMYFTHLIKKTIEKPLLVAF
jgi:chemotaxis family two-component system response regulator PixH